MRRVLRWVVPADDQWHEIETRGQVLHVATRSSRHAELWTEDDDGEKPLAMQFRVFGTGQPGVEGVYVGTAIAPGGDLVWHVYCRTVK